MIQIIHEEKILEKDYIYNPLNQLSMIIEALRVDDKSKKKIQRHNVKIFGYDEHGLFNNCILVYVEKDFANLWEFYKTEVLEIDYPYPLVGQQFGIQIEKLEDVTAIRYGWTKHKRDGKIITLHHIFADFSIRTMKKGINGNGEEIINY